MNAVPIRLPACLQEGQLKPRRSLEAFLSAQRHHSTKPLLSQVIQRLTELPDTSLGKMDLWTSWGRNRAESGKKVWRQTHEFKTQIQYFLPVRSLSLKSTKPHFPHRYKWTEQHLSHNFHKDSTLSPWFHQAGINASPSCFLKTELTFLSQSILGVMSFVCVVFCPCQGTADLLGTYLHSLIAIDQISIMWQAASWVLRIHQWIDKVAPLMGLIVW